MTEPLLPPWQALHPALTGPRLAALADLIVEARRAKIGRRDPRDTAWNLGCDCYAWMCEAFHSAAAGCHADWLGVESKRGEMELLVRIGKPDGPPVKIYRSDVQGQPQRTLRQSHEELRVRQECLALGLAVTADAVLRLAVHTDERGLVTAITLVQLDAEGGVLYPWPVWARDVASIDRAPLPEGVELDEPAVGLPEDEAADERRRDGQQGSA